ncbi:hypothetical protein [Nitrospira defluvii]|uniref:hypothetical protein n=1 Tax=Nitrospira defluvii TaxID=330214 RepID=UPI001BB4768F|nr:hypothetical protein [Nitrospira defluvii]
MAACKGRGPALLSLPVCEPFECFLIDREIFPFSNGDDFNQDFLVDDRYSMRIDVFAA